MLPAGQSQSAVDVRPAEPDAAATAKAFTEAYTTRCAGIILSSLLTLKDAPTIFDVMALPIPVMAEPRRQPITWESRDAQSTAGGSTVIFSMGYSPVRCASGMDTPPGLLAMLAFEYAPVQRNGEFTQAATLFPAPEGGGAMYVRNDVYRFGPGSKPFSTGLDPTGSGAAFVQQYYQAYSAARASLAALYLETSQLTFEGRTTTGAAAIIERVMAMPTGRQSVDTIDVQPASPDGSLLLVLVTGRMELSAVHGSSPLAFAQAFLLQLAAASPPSIVSEFFRLRYVHKAAPEGPVTAAAKVGDVRALWRALEAGGSTGEESSLMELSPLHHAAERGHFAAVQALLEAGAHACAWGPYGTRPLHLAASNGHLAVVQALLKAGADASAKGVGDETPLHCAVGRSGVVAIVQALAEAGTNLDVRSETVRWDYGAQAPLHIAAATNPSTVDALVRAGGDVNIPDYNDRTPLHYAGSTTVIKILAAAGARIDSTDEEGETPLHSAVKGGRLDLVQAFIEAGASLDAQAWPTSLGFQENTYKPVRREWWPCDDVAAREEVQRALSGIRKSDRFRWKEYGWTPLHWAAYKGDLAIAQALVKAGASLEAKTVIGLTPAEWARIHGQAEVLAFLESVAAFECSAEPSA